MGHHSINVAVVAAALRETEPELVSEVEYWRNNPPNPATHPATKAIVDGYVLRLEKFLPYIRAGADGLRKNFEEFPGLLSEIDELKTWIYPNKRAVEAGREFIAANKDAVGDWLVSTGMSYSETSETLDRAKRLKMGAPPSQRQVTLQLLNLRKTEEISYSELAEKFCDCPAKQHDDHCSERLRKRVASLENMMARLGIKA